MHNASCYKRRYSRRRIAALSFLSNISLDGSQQPDSKIGLGSQNCTSDGKSSKKEDDYSVTCTFLTEGKHKNVLKCTSTEHQFEGSPFGSIPEIIDNLKNKVGPGTLHYTSTGQKEGKRKIDEDAKTKNGSVCVFRERSATIGTYGKSSSISQLVKSTALNQLGTSVCNPLAVIPGLTLPLQHPDKTNLQASFENFEPPSSGYLLPITSHSRRLSSNTSEGSHSPTGSGFREKEVRFLTSIRDFATHLADQRLVLVTGQCSPIVVFSTLPFSRCYKLSRGDFRGDSGRRRQASGTRPTSAIGDFPDLYTLLGLPKPEEGQVISYCQMLVPSSHFSRESSASRRIQSTGDYHHEPDLLPSNKGANPTFNRCFSQDAAAFRTNYGRPASPLVSLDNPKVDVNEEGSGILPSHVNYHPSLLDDPELWIAGKHSTLLTFPSYMTSVIDYVKPSDLKKELNDKFREKFPHIQLTLSKLRSLKREMRKVAKQESGADLLTVAQAYVYFEKLILRGLVHKGNRKLCAGAALLLSAKMNDVKGDTLKTLIEEIQNNFRVSRRELFTSEFAVLVALEFSLHIPTWEIFSHYQRLLYDS